MKLRFKDKMFLVVVVLILAFVGVDVIFTYFTGSQNRIESKTDKTAVLKLKDKKIIVEFANTKEERALGLSYRKDLLENRGMLFVHEGAGRYVYSMNGMMFDLDFIFILDNVVVDIARNVSRAYNGEVAGATDYDMVLEVNSSWVRKNEIEIGDKIEIK